MNTLVSWSHAAFFGQFDSKSFDGVLPASFHMDTSVLLASVIWGGLGFGFFVYGKKQRSAPPLFGGIAMMAITYFITDSALWMSVAAVGILFGIYVWSRNS